MPNITISIPTAKVAEARQGFLTTYPKPEGFGGTDMEWVEKMIRIWFTEQVITGLRRQAYKAATVDADYTED